MSFIHPLIHSFNQPTLHWGLTEGESRFHLEDVLPTTPHLFLTISTGPLAANSASACGWLMGISESTLPIPNRWYLSPSQTFSSPRLSHLKGWCLHLPTGSSQNLGGGIFDFSFNFMPKSNPAPSRLWINTDLMTGGWMRVNEWTTLWAAYTCSSSLCHFISHRNVCSCHGDAAWVTVHMNKDFYILKNLLFPGNRLCLSDCLLSFFFFNHWRSWNQTKVICISIFIS